MVKNFGSFARPQEWRCTANTAFLGGCFVEGIDGSGKSTQLSLLKKSLESEGCVVYFSEWSSLPLVHEDDLVTRVLQSGGFDYWESGMDLRMGEDLYESFIRYQ